MFKNYLKIALRTLRRHKIYAGINILGLALGIACCLVILLTVQRELSYDRFHPDADRLYRVVQDVSWGSGSTWSWTGGPMGPVLEEDFTEVEASTRLVVESRLVEAEIDGRDTRFQEDRFGFADPSFFELFRFDFISGDPATALADPQAVVLTASMAAKYFGDADPMGRELEVSNSQTLRVTGVIEDVPDNTHLDFDCVGSLQALMQLYGTPDFRESWWWPNTATYVRLSGTAANPTTVDRLNATDLPAFIQRHREPQYATAILPRLQPVTDIHLYDNPGDNAISFVYIFSVIAFFILLIACVNYMNLATARSALRAREVGVRKAIGAVRSQLVQQFYGESICVTLIALLVGLLLAETMLPLFNELLDRNLNLNYADPLLWTGLLGIGLVVGLLAGSYPALVLSRFNPVRVLKGASGHTTGGRSLRRSLVVVQFGISITLIVSTLIVYQQVDYMRTKSLGFDEDQLVALPIPSNDVRSAYDSFRLDLARVPGVTNVTASSWLPGVGGTSGWSFSFEGMPEGLNAYAPALIYVAPDFFETVGIPIQEGRAPSEDIASDVNEAFVVNQVAVDQYQVEDPVGRRFRLSGEENGQIVYEKTGRVIGVMEDFHMYNLRTAITPAVITPAEHASYLNYVLARLAPDQMESTLDGIETAWTSRFPEWPFQFSFVDDRIDALYEQDESLGQLVAFFAALAIVIACLGLFGLAAFTAEQRRKEIGVRKILGASVSNIILLLSKDFAALVIVAAVVALPLAYFGINRWLEDYAYAVELSPTIFILAAVLALTVALLTVSYQALKAARLNPVESLRYE